jgi:hypothetical protein
MKSNSFYLVMIFVAGSSLGMVEDAEATWYSAPAYSFPGQEERCWCGVALAQGWTGDLTGYWYSQYDLAPWELKPCPISGLLSGLNAGELADIMNDYAGYGAGYGRTFYYSNTSTRAAAEAALVSAIKNSRRAVALASNTVYSDGSMREGGHWMKVWAVEITSSALNFIKVHDPLWNSQWRWNYQSLPQDYALRRLDWKDSAGILKLGFQSRWSPIAAGKWQHVTYY